MQNILTSASKIVFILVALTACLAFMYEIVFGKALMDPKDFIGLVLMAFTFYFANKGETNPPAGTPPFAGK